ncbi:ABC transporter ATP-binding protein [Alisedimentitalea sp. MJ-SS2]|uniref:ABC transporter ATP-binding protein n=1 Tax=Aliisedimentitalea sp. MJ-SS2 TaxID=3049795 RepID=UPI00290D7D15|nr:ABC transporter ATP-binding protein [Alisedimentitalea sp. MJ-SS2]MDU8929863.1 ABC transporter ATP-binding protein [Alisedimentitalea sp. MJ-SS2]
MKPQDWIDPFARADEMPPDNLGAFFRWALKGAWGPVLLTALVSISGGVAEVIAALLLGYLIDATLVAGPEGFFASNAWLLAVGVLFFLGLRPVLFGANAFLQTVVIQPNILSLTLSRLHRFTLGQSVTFFDDDFAGRIAQKELQTATALNDVVVETIQTVLFATASVLGTLWMVTAIDWRIGVPLVLWVGGYILFIRHFIPKIRKRSKARAAARADVTGQIVDTVTNIKTVKLFAHADHEDRAALGAIGGYRQRFIEFGRMAAAFRFWLMTLAGLVPVLLLGTALYVWTQGNITAGQIVATGTVAIRLAQMTGWVSFAMMVIYSHIGEVEDGIQTLTRRVRLPELDNAALAVSQGEIAFDNVSFAYGRESGGVQDIALTIRPGEKLGIVGASGAGKSTLVALLLRLYDPERGAVRIDGQAISHVSEISLRRAIGMVTQETALFNRTARDNILYGRPDASEEELRAAAAKAEADEFILGLEDGEGRQGYEAFLGERGVKLSGGQRQRIALARAILKDAPILVLDEATSALDSEVEAAIQTALTRVMEGKTVLAIAHRLSTIAQMDRIVVLDAGRIVEEGSHEVLLAQGGIYAGLWAHQSGGFIGIEEAAE